MVRIAHYALLRVQTRCPRHASDGRREESTYLCKSTFSHFWIWFFFFCKAFLISWWWFTAGRRTSWCANFGMSVAGPLSLCPAPGKEIPIRNRVEICCPKWSVGSKDYLRKASGVIESNRVDGVQLKEDPPCSPCSNPVFQLKLRTHPLAGTLAFQLAAVIVRYVWSIRLCRLFCNLWYSNQAPNSSSALYFFNFSSISTRLLVEETQ